MKKNENALVLTLVLMGIILLAGNIMTWTWSYNDDGLCDACGAPARYQVEVIGMGGAENKVTNEFCWDHGFLWGLFNPWAPAEGLYGLHWVSLFVLFVIFFGCSALGFRVRQKIMESGKRSFLAVAILIFITCVGVFSGSATAYATTTTTPSWENKSEVVASEKTLQVSGWQSKSEVLAENESISALPKYESKNETLVDWVIWVPDHKTYSYTVEGCSASVDATNFVISGNAMETSIPQKPFNLYIFDGPNFLLYREANETYTAYYEAKNKTSVSFNFYFTEIPQVGGFYFVAERQVPDVDLWVSVKATVSWIDKNTNFAYVSEHTESIRDPDLFNYTFKNFVLNGRVTETRGKEFNFYIMDSGYLDEFRLGLPYRTLYDSRNCSVVEFSVPLTGSEGYNEFCFVVENPLEIDEVANCVISASISWIEKPSQYCYFEYVGPEIGYGEAQDFVLTGTATEENDHKFNFYITGSIIYENWKEWPWFEARDVTTASFSLSLNSSWPILFVTGNPIFFVAENPLVDVDEVVKISATLEYECVSVQEMTKRNVLAVTAFLSGLVAIVAGPSVSMVRSLKREN